MCYMIWAFDHFHERSINTGIFGLTDLNLGSPGYPSRDSRPTTRDRRDSNQALEIRMISGPLGLRQS